MNKRKDMTNLLLIVSCAVLVWFSKGLIFAGGEEGLFFQNLSKHSVLISHVWYDDGTGAPVYAFLTQIPYFSFVGFLGRFIPGFFLQIVTFLFLALVGVASMYTLSLELFEKKQSIAFTAGLFYFFNPYSMSQVWGRGLYPQFFTFALVPLFLLCFVRFLSTRQTRFILLALGATVIFSPAFTLVTNVAALWATVLLYAVYRAFSKGKSLRPVFVVLTLFAVWLCVHAWWIFPIYKGALAAFSLALSNVHENIGTLLGVSAHFPFYLLIRLMQKHYFFLAKTYGEVYGSLWFALLSWVPPFVILFSLSSLKKYKNAVFALLLFGSGLLVSLGANPPFGKVFVWFFTEFPVLQAFRNPYEKFGLVYLLGYTFLFAIGVENLIRRFPSAWIKPILLMLTCGVLVWPLWTGRFAGQLAWTRVPSYYKDANEWLNMQDGDFRIIQFPLVSGDGVRYNWEHPYQGIEPGAVLFDKSSIGRNVVINKPYYNVLLQRFGNFYPGAFGPDPDLSESEFRSEELWQELAKLGVRYVVFHHDLDDAGIGEKMTKDDFEKIVQNEEQILKVQSFGELDIYEVTIPASIQRISSPNIDITYTKRSPTRYAGHIFSKEGSNTDIYFLDIFDPGWELLIDGEKVNDHTKVFSYANKWTFDGAEEEEFELEYKPQKNVEKGIKITIISSFLLLLFAFLSTHRWY